MQTYKPEADTVRLIYRQYIQGASMGGITELLSGNGVHYHDGNPAWNKSMVKRILENPRYTGSAEYPAIIDPLDYEATAAVKAAKTQYNPAPQSIVAIRKKAVCAVCSGRMTREIKKRGYEKWRCKNEQCTTSIRITDNMLISGVTALLNTLIADPAAAEPASIPQNSKSLEAMRLQNEANRELEKPRPDVRRVKELLYQCAAQKYLDCGGCVPLHLADKVRIALNNREQLAEFDPELFESIVEQVHIEPDGGVHLWLITQIMM